MSAHEIIRIANELAARGVTPTTAMVKARLTHPVPMADLLKALSQWKQQPVAPAESESWPEVLPQPAPAITLQQLAEQLARLEQKVDLLTTLLTAQGKK